MATSTDKNGAIENHESIFKGGHAAYIAHVERFMALAQGYCTSVADTVTDEFSPMASMDIALKLMITESMELFAKHNLVCFDRTTPSSIKKEIIDLLDGVAMPNAKNQAARIKEDGGLQAMVESPLTGAFYCLAFFHQPRQPCAPILGGHVIIVNFFRSAPA
jgi:hypothetical protein